MRNEVNVNANILTWAIARTGYELISFTDKFLYIQLWLEGQKKPTVKQLEDFSKKVHLPFGYLFLTEPPKETLPIPFFRSKANQTQKISINIYDTILLMLQRQDWANLPTALGFPAAIFVGIRSLYINKKKNIRNARVEYEEEFCNYSKLRKDFIYEKTDFGSGLQL